MSPKHLHFERAFLPREWAQNRLCENPFPIILRDCAVKPPACDIAFAGADARFPPLRIWTRRKTTER